MADSLADLLDFYQREDADAEAGPLGGSTGVEDRPPETFSVRVSRDPSFRCSCFSVKGVNSFAPKRF